MLYEVITIYEVLVYFPSYPNKFFYKLIKNIYYLKAYLVGLQNLKKKKFLPDVIHANILTRTGLMALLIGKFKKVPYVITEHWSRYLLNRNSFKGCVRVFITKLVVKNAEAILPVSDCLKNAMLAHHLHNSNYNVVNNVVDDFFFITQSQKLRERKRIIHISCFDEAAKNIKGILRATLELSKKRQDFELIIIGNGIDFNEVHDYYISLDFKEKIVLFFGEKSPEQVSECLHKSDFFVLFSNYENSPVVISESLACGKPVISTNVGGISEHVNSSNGILLNAGDEKALTESMDKMLDNFQNYDVDKIKEEARMKFSYENVGNKIWKIYKSVLQ